MFNRKKKLIQQLQQEISNLKIRIESLQISRQSWIESWEKERNLLDTYFKNISDDDLKSAEIIDNENFKIYTKSLLEKHEFGPCFLSKHYIAAVIAERVKHAIEEDRRKNG